MSWFVQSGKGVRRTIGFAALVLALAVEAPASASTTATATLAPAGAGTFVLTVTNTGSDPIVSFGAVPQDGSITKVVPSPACQNHQNDFVCNLTLAPMASQQVCFTDSAMGTLEPVQVTVGQGGEAHEDIFNTTAAPSVGACPVANKPGGGGGGRIWKRAQCNSSLGSWRGQHRHATVLQKRAEVSELGKLHGCTFAKPS